MRTLTPPVTDEADLYDRLCSRRASATALALESAREGVLDAYSIYAAGSVTGLETVIDEKTLAAHLRSNYAVLRSGALKDDGALVLARSRICCLCGIRDVSELDHYLPKKLFPEFAAYTLNLVPACGVCNKRKDEDYRTAHGGAAFVHAYLDQLPLDERFLQGSVEIGRAVIPVFRLVRTQSIPASTFAALMDQFERFQLGSTYADEAAELLYEKHGAIEDYFADGGAQSVQRYLRRDAQSAERLYGINHWKPVALHAAAESAHFCAGGFALLTA